MDGIETNPTEHEEGLHDQEGKPSTISADNTEKKPTDHEQVLHGQEGKPSTISEDNMEKKTTDQEKAKEILKELKKLFELESIVISGDDIENLQKFLSELQKKLSKDEEKKPNEEKAKGILKKVEELLEHEPSVISGDDIKNLQKLQSELLKKLPPKKHQQLRLVEGKLDPILKNFKVSYDNLKYESRICLLYLSIFPENAVIKKRPIIYWWIANGLVKETTTGEKKKTAEEVGQDIFEDLLQSHLIMACQKNNISIVNKCRIHPWIHHMLITFARKSNLFDFDPDGMLGYRNASSGHVCLPKDGDSKKLTHEKPVKLQQSSKGNTAASSHVSLQEDDPSKMLHVGSQEDGGSQKQMDSKEQGEHRQSSVGKTANSGRNCFKTLFNVGDGYLSPNPTRFGDKKLVGRQQSCPQEDDDSQKQSEHREERHYFKTLFNVGDGYLSLNPPWFTDKKLVALQLGRSRASPRHHIEVESDDLLSKALRTQKFLKYLSLRGISRITNVTWILELTNLEILDLKACHNLETLPNDISALRKLTHLDVSDCYLLDGMPDGLGKLTSLQALKGFIIAESKRTPTRIGDLKSLVNLKQFSIRIGSEAEILGGEFQQLEQLKSVQRLKISWGVVSKEKREQVMKDEYNLPTTLEKLTLEGLPHDNYPGWLKPSKLRNLKVLSIEGGNLKGLDHGEFGEHDWKVEILRLWYISKGTGIDEDKARHWFPYLSHVPDIKYREDDHPHSQKAKGTQKT